jgi:choloylglycine hydrolase
MRPRSDHDRSAGPVGASRGRVAAVFLLAFVTALAASCGDSTESPSADSSTKTLSSLRKIDAYPLYVLRYYGDYGFSGYLSDPDRGDASPAVDEPAGDWGCTTFSAVTPDGKPLLARNFDWYNHIALLVYTDPPEASASVSMVDLSYLGFVPDDASDENLRKLLRVPYWPFDGMNEHGVAIGMMAVPHAEGGDDPGKPTIGSLDAIRLVLDYAKNVEEAVSLLGRYNIDFAGGPPVHYLVSDPAPRSVVIEFLDDEMIVIPSGAAWQVATNFIVSGYPFGDPPSGCWRYNLVYNALEGKNGAVTSDGAMNLLEDCSQPITMWSVVYGGEDETVSVTAGREYSNVHRFTLEELKQLR